MNNILILIMSIVYMLFAMGYNTTTPSASNTTSDEEVVTPTGYPTGELQKEYVFWNGKLYTYDVIYIKSLPEGANEIGEVEKIDNVNYPDENLEAAHLPVGTAVYADDTYLYVAIVSGGYERFSVCNDAIPQTDETVAPTGYPTGELQSQYVFWNGKLYTASYDAVFTKSLPADACQVGKIASIDNVNYPDEDLEAAHTDVGAVVYVETSGQYLFVDAGIWGYERFSVCNDASIAHKSEAPSPD